MAPSTRRSRAFASLQTKTAALLTLSLVPLGALSILQSVGERQNAEDAAFSSLSAQTAKAAAPEREAISEALASARAMAAALPEIGTDTEACGTLARRIVEAQQSYSYVGFTDLSLTSTCNNFGDTFDFSFDEDAQGLLDNPRSDVSYVSQGAASGEAVVVATEPARDASGMLVGLVSVSFPAATLAAGGDETPVKIVTFNHLGETLTSDMPTEELQKLLPQGTALADLAVLAGRSDTGFIAESVSGDAHKYSVVAIVPERAYALGIWLHKQQPRSYAFIVPVLMWLVTLAVAIYALRGQVIYPVTLLGQQMRRFARQREVADLGFNEAIPREFHEIGEDFDAMATKIVRDEAEAEDKLRERELLLQELHHRVSNNLQIISSVLNMHLRKTDDLVLGSVLTGIQGRLSSISRFHQALYQNNFNGRLDVTPILKDVLKDLALAVSDSDLKLEMETKLEPLDLAADAAVNLTLFVFETASYAVEVMAQSGVKEGRLALASEQNDGNLTVTLSASPVGRVDRLDGQDRLIKAFAAQLRGTLSTKANGETLIRQLRMPLSEITNAAEIKRY